MRRRTVRFPRRKACRDSLIGGVVEVSQVPVVCCESCRTSPPRGTGCSDAGTFAKPSFLRHIVLLLTSTCAASAPASLVCVSHIVRSRVTDALSELPFKSRRLQLLAFRIKPSDEAEWTETEQIRSQRYFRICRARSVQMMEQLLYTAVPPT